MSRSTLGTASMAAVFVSSLYAQGTFPAPNIDAVCPATVSVGQPVTIDLYGQNLFMGPNYPLGTVAGLAPLGQTPQPPFLPLSGNPGHVTVTVPAARLSVTGTLGIQVIANFPPFLSSISPNAVSFGSPQFTLLVNGSGFVPGAEVRWSRASGAFVAETALTTTFISGSQLTAVVPASLIATAGSANIIVVNPGTVPSGGLPLNIFIPGPASIPPSPSFRSPRAEATATNDIASNTAFLNVIPPPTIFALQPSTITQGASGVTLVIQGANFIPAAVTSSTALGTCTRTSVILVNGVPQNAQIRSANDAVITLSPQTLAASTVTIAVDNFGVRSNTVTLATTPPPTIVSSNLPTGIVGRPYPTNRIDVAGGTGPLTWTLSPPNIGLTITPNGSSAVISGVPTVAGSITVTVQVLDAFSVAAVRSYPITILPLPAVTLSLAATISPASPTNVQISVPASYPVAVTGTLQLAFQPSPDLKANTTTRDPALSLQSSGTFTTDPKTGTASIALNPGTAAGTITVTLANLATAGVDVTPAGNGGPLATAIIVSGPPVFTCTQSRSGQALSLLITGFSSTREVTRASFLFTPASGKELSTSRINRDDAGTALFGPYYSTQFTSFNYNQNFTVNGHLEDIGTVSVTLENGKGASPPVVCQ